MYYNLFCCIFIRSKERDYMEVSSKVLSKSKSNLSSWKVLLPSTLGILLFMVPLFDGEKVTIPVAALSSLFLNLMDNMVSDLLLASMIISSIGMVLFKIGRLNFIKHPGLRSILDPSSFWAGTRLLGTAFSLLTYLHMGPNSIINSNTGGLIFFDLMPTLFAVFLFAGIFLPLLMDFGLLELAGALLSKVMRPLFKLPGRSSIDCIASWLGDGTIGVLLTSKQYEDGFYTEKEAAIIGTTFSAVSITFSLVVIAQVGLSHMFIPFYATVLFTGFVAAVIMPRLSPLKNKSDHYNKPTNNSNPNTVSLSEGWQLALQRANKNADLKKLVSNGFMNVLDMWLGVLPIVMAMGTLALVLAEYTPIFSWLGLPFIPLLKVLQIPEAKLASETIMVGFADMFLPSVLAASIKSELTRFVIACLSVTQLIYMSEVGGLLLGSKIPVSLQELMVIFLQRTLISLPIIACIAHLVF